MPDANDVAFVNVKADLWPNPTQLKAPIHRHLMRARRDRHELCTRRQLQTVAVHYRGESGPGASLHVRGDLDPGTGCHPNRMQGLRLRSEKYRHLASGRMDGVNKRQERFFAHPVLVTVVGVVFWATVVTAFEALTTDDAPVWSTALLAVIVGSILLVPINLTIYRRLKRERG